MNYAIEYTDTFGGEANYSWVRRATVDAPETLTDSALRRLAKKTLGLSGVRGRWASLGETLEFRPHGSCTVLFIYPAY